MPRINFWRISNPYVAALVVMAALVLLFFLFKPIAIYIFLAILVALLLRPVTEWLSSRKLVGKNRMPRPVAAMLSLLVVFIFLGLLFLIITPTIVKEVSMISSIEADSVAARYEPYLSQWNEFAADYGIDYTSDSILASVERLRADLVPTPSELATFASEALGVAGNILLGFGSVLFITFYLLLDRRLLPLTILFITPAAYNFRVMRIYYKIKWVIRRYFMGLIIQLSIFIILYYAGLGILGVPNAFFLAVFSGLMNMVPYIGPIIAAIIGGVIIVISGLHASANELLINLIKMGGVAGVVQFLDNWLITPMVYSNSVKAHPLEIFLVILMGGHLWGIAGMVIAVPTYTIMRVVLREVFPNNKVINRLTSDLNQAITKSNKKAATEAESA